jgi:hypothetical protein
VKGLRRPVPAAHRFATLALGVLNSKIEVMCDLELESVSNDKKNPDPVFVFAE